MPSFALSLQIARRPDEVFAYLTDVDRLPEWQSTAVEAEGPPFDPVTTPAWCIARYEYPARGEQPPLKLTWYDSGKQPELAQSLSQRLALYQQGRAYRSASTPTDVRNVSHESPAPPAATDDDGR